jgi:hypothetical protein
VRYGSHAVVLSLVLVAIDAHAEDKACMTAAAKGQELRDQGHLIEARAQFQTCVQSDCPAPIPTYCGDWLADVARKMPSLVIRAVDENSHDVTDAAALLDDQPVSLNGRAVEVDPGKHRVRISCPGKKTFEAEILAAQGEKDRVVVGKVTSDVADSVPMHARGRVPIASWIGWGIGAVGLISFTSFGIKARVDYDNFQSSCGNHCAMSDRDTVATSVTIADVSLVVGLLAAGVGTAFYFLQPTVAAPAARTSGAR